MSEKKTKGDKKVQTEIRESAQKIWLAGLGALALAEEEGGKLFRSLVEKGEGFEKRSRARVQEVQEKVGGRIDEARGKAESTWNKLGDSFDERVAGTLKRVGVPTRLEIQKLTKRVEELTIKVDQLGKPRSRTAKRQTKSRKSA